MGAPSTLPPPPKFPSLTDVALPHAKAAAPTSLAPELEEEGFLHPDFGDVIRRDTVERGSSARRALEIASQQWTNTDQEELNRLLAEGQDVLVPPDVCSDDIPVPPASGYAYFPAEAENDPTGWHRLVPTAEPRPVSPVAVSTRYTPFPATSFPPAPQSPPPAQMQVIHEQPPPPVHERSFQPDQAPERKQEEEPKTDVSRTIFGGHFHVVPVKSRVNTAAGKEIVPVDPKRSTEEDNMHRVTLRLDSTADVNVMEDYGLKGGHDDVVHDAVFLSGDKTLATCGSDGRVCIWDMAQREVYREFLPYDGEPVTMIYPLPNDEEGDTSTTTILTLSSSRSLRIWIVDDYQAVMLRDSMVQESEGDLYMNVPRISKELKARAIAAATAAAIRTSDAPEDSVLAGTADEIEGETSTAAPVDEGFADEQAPESAYVAKPSHAVEPSPEVEFPYAAEPGHSPEPVVMEPVETETNYDSPGGRNFRLPRLRKSISLKKKALAS